MIFKFLIKGERWRTAIFRSFFEAKNGQNSK
jgi:hypothetical protein